MRSSGFWARIGGILVSVAVLAAGLIWLTSPRGDETLLQTVAKAAPSDIEESLVPNHREPPPPPPLPKPKPKAVAKPKPKPLAANVDAYRGMGAWVDVYDYRLRDDMNPEAAVDEMARRGVKTLYIQTSRWKEPNDFVDAGKLGRFLDRASSKGIRVVGWYLPGFGNLDRDIRRSLAVLNFVSPAGNRFSGFAPDIETAEEVGGNRARFNAGIAEYSRRLRAAAPNRVLGAIVVDAKNNERAPKKWAGFPWKEVGQNYDVILPMAYWTATKPRNGCLSTNKDTAGYMKEVVSKTTALMGRSRPFHLIGGVANCITVTETANYVTASKTLGTLGVSLYDFQTTQSHTSRDALWGKLSAFGG